MNFNPKRVIAIKESNQTISTRFNSLKKNINNIDLLNYIDYVRNQPTKTILENSRYVFSEPLYGSEFYKFVIETHNIIPTKLIEQRTVIENYITTLKNARYSNREHLNILTECINIIDNKIATLESPESLKQNILESFHFNKLYTITLESKIDDDFDKIINNINYHPEYADDYKRLVAKIEAEKDVNAIKHFPLLLVKNTSLVIGMVLMTVGVIGAMVTTLPTIIIAKLANIAIEKSTINSYCKVLDGEIHRLETSNNDNEPNKKKFIENYIATLKSCKEQLCKTSVKESSDNILEEGLALMAAPFLVPVPKKWIKLVYKFGWETKEKIIHDDISKITSTKKIDTYIDSLTKYRDYLEHIKNEPTVPETVFKYWWFYGVNAQNQVQVLIELHNKTIHLLEKRKEELKNQPKSSVKEGSTDLSLDDIVPAIMNDMDDELLMIEDGVDDDTDFEDVEDQIIETTMNFIFDEDERTYSLEAFNKMIRLERILHPVNEELTNVQKVLHGTRKVANVVDKARDAADRNVEPASDYASSIIDSVKKLDKDERRNRLIEGKFRFKLLKVVRDAAILGGAIALHVHPALLAIGIIGRFAMDKTLDIRVKREIITELKEELKIVEEKIDDAKSDSKRAEKYQLMRIKNKLEQEIERIEYNLKKF